MNRETIIPKNEADWLAMRDKDLTSTEAAALFQSSPYTTQFEMYHRKLGLVESNFNDNERTIWGRRLESSIAQGIAEDYGVIVEPMKCYMRIPGLRLGSSFDFKIVGLADDWEGEDAHLRYLFQINGPGIMEVKNVDGLQFKRTWTEDGEEVEAPAHIEYQIQHQLLVSGFAWAAGAALIGGNRPVVFTREADKEIADEILARSKIFWVNVDSQTPPAPDFNNDLDTIKKLNNFDDGSVIDLGENMALFTACKTYKQQGEIAKEANTKKDAAMAVIRDAVKAAHQAHCLEYKISSAMIASSYRTYVRDETERIAIYVTKLKAKKMEFEVAATRRMTVSKKK